MPEHCCGTCRYHVRPSDAQAGECHGAPPSVLRYWSVQGLVTLAQWPVTAVEEWCKEWEWEADPETEPPGSLLA